jgi:uncharacterized membrane protein
MEGWMAEVVRIIVIAIEAIAVLIVAFASAEAFVHVLRLAVRTSAEAERQKVYLRYLRWLVAALTFQLAADIAHTAIEASWQQLGKVAAVAAIRAFTNYFLERDLREAAARE